MADAGADPRSVDDNPFGVDGAMEFSASIPPDLAAWNEGYFFQAWDPDRSIGLWLHTSRMHGSLEVWCSCLAVYLPAGELLVSRSFGKAPDRRGPASGELRIVCEEPLRRWRVTFDGGAELVSAADLGRSTCGAGTVDPARLDLVFTALSPVYDLFAAIGRPPADPGFTHHEQGLRVAGAVTVGGKDLGFEGFGYRDHSSGVRDFTTRGGNGMLYACFPSGRVIQGIETFARGGGVRFTSGYLFDDGRFNRLDPVEMPDMADTLGNPSKLLVAFQRGSELIESRWDVLHNATLTIDDRYQWSIGVNDAATDPLIITESPCRVEWPGGEIGWGTVERNLRRSVIGHGGMGAMRRVRLQ